MTLREFASKLPVDDDRVVDAEIRDIYLLTFGTSPRIGIDLANGLCVWIDDDTVTIDDDPMPF